jgi:hypothetical protein
MEPLWTRLWAEREENMKVKQGKIHADWAKIDADREKRRAYMKDFNEIIKRRGGLKEKPTRRSGWPSGKLAEKKKG